MKKIHLLSPAVTNSGAYLDAGNDVGVGEGSTQIAPDRAKELLDTFRATAAADEAAHAAKK